jgi:hypothetical protein
MAKATTVHATQEKVALTINEDTITVNVQPQTTQIEVSSAVATGASNIPFTGQGTLSSTGNIAEALQVLADQFYVSTTPPQAGDANLEEGDLFYDTDDNQLKIYRETSSGTFSFVPIMIGNESADSDTVDAGGF